MGDGLAHRESLAERGVSRDTAIQQAAQYMRLRDYTGSEGIERLFEEERKKLFLQAAYMLHHTDSENNPEELPRANLFSRICSAVSSPRA